MTKYKTIHRYNQHYKNFNFSDLTPQAEEEYLDLTIELDADGKVVSESKFTTDGELEERSTFVYGPHGKLVEHELFYVVDDAREKRVLTRNEKGYLLSEVKYYGDEEGSRTNYEYDQKDNIVAIINLDEEGVFVSREEVKYDDKGVIVERVMIDSDNKVVSKTTFNYLSATQIEEIETDAKGQLTSKTMNTFDDKGNELSTVQTNPQGKLISAISNVYDDRGNIVEKIYKDFYSKKVKNEYDDLNRLIKQEIYDNTGMLVKRNAYVYDDEGNVLEEQNYEMDSSRGGRDRHYGTRYEYLQ